MANEKRKKWAEDRQKRYKPKVEDSGTKRERNVGINEEHSRVAKGGGRQGGKKKP